MVSPKKNDEPSTTRLAKRTVQIIGFGFAIILTIIKIVSPESDIPWPVIFGFFGFGVAGDGSLVDAISGIFNGKK